MKKLIYVFFLIPFTVFSQSENEYAVLQNAMLTVQPDKVRQFEAAVAAHNKKFHAEDGFGAQVYNIASGPNAGKYIWQMQGMPWGMLDNRPDSDEHNEDWRDNVRAYLMPEAEVIYWKFEAKLSNFPKDFTLNKIRIDYWDISRFQGEKVMKMMKKVRQVMVKEFPEETYGIYTNEMSSTNDGKDIVFASFFDKWNWMGIDGKFSEKYEKVFGKGSWLKAMKEWAEITEGGSSEIWVFRQDLSGPDGKFKVSD